MGVRTLSRDPVAELLEATPADAEVAVYDLFTGQRVFAWPGRDACAAPTSCPARE